jgi:hypothetical protein
MVRLKRNKFEAVDDGLPLSLISPLSWLAASSMGRLRKKPNRQYLQNRSIAAFGMAVVRVKGSKENRCRRFSKNSRWATPTSW